MAEQLIRAQVEAWAKAISAKDIASLMSCYAPSVVSFDLDPPLRYSGADEKRRAWEEFCAAFPGAVSYEVSELSIAAGADTAFVHSLNHVTGRRASGQVSELWLRWTACFRRIDANWLIVHDHASVPADLAHGRAMVDLTP
ncbi:MAG TPA: nuclear transport factor 2 family protein [Polyangiaceae bacterium]|nr:nuclear transport factor 2 family protein [Polyangiaceae bacterium]